MRFVLRRNNVADLTRKIGVESAKPLPKGSDMASSIFSAVFWKIATEQAVHAAAGGALGVLTSGGFHLIGDVPWYGVVSSAGIGALTSVLISLSSQAAPNDTLPASFVAAPPSVPRRRPSRRRRPRATETK